MGFDITNTWPAELSPDQCSVSYSSRKTRVLVVIQFAGVKVVSDVRDHLSTHKGVN